MTTKLESFTYELHSKWAIENKEIKLLTKVRDIEIRDR